MKLDQAVKYLALIFVVFISFSAMAQVSVEPTVVDVTAQNQNDPAQNDPNQVVNEISEDLLEEDVSFSDLAIEEMFHNQSGSARNPFAPGVAEEEFDPSTLVIEGIVIGPGVKYALISGQIFAVKDRIGYYTISDIKPGRVILSQLEDKFIVRMDGYTTASQKRQVGKYTVDFQNAPLKEGLTLLSKTEGINIIMPEETAGKVTGSFTNTMPQDVIASILRVNSLEYAYENNIMRIGPADQFKDDSDLKAISIPLNYATAKELEEKVKTFLSERGSTISDERTNIIIVKDHANVIDNVRKFLVSVDRQDPQVSIEAKIIDASRTFVRSLGIQWGLTTGPNNIIARGNQDAGSITNGSNTGTIVNLPANNPTSGLDLLVGRLPGNTTLQAQLSAAESDGTIRIISKPNVTTINNKTANIRSGVKLYVKVDGGADQGPALQEIDTGIELKVTPQITLNRMIKMNIEAIQSEADFSRTVDNIPSILDNTATTTVLVPDGETAVIGGLLRVNATKEKRGVPGISKIPILGWLFKSSTKTKTNKELMIFITPKILDQKFFETKHKTAVTHTPTQIQ